ncbi:DNA polymerase/3'-5' exonuclease PolX [Marinithermus hydrothermalis]|uniref:PHP domain protein n=1 Tax=Marinithermus hydrothermalis (strain DSM 14884 / JCM 11576 / T1) TaxID=869210 RepID=F2NR16_MARHT|nr:DNA polymerase/3'-5' exonuclease PolX [Marinithermus hydrothermalis]AEB12594.1 PHP domain protein [Marinithermus hydrothermalis DSM 14884]
MNRKELARLLARAADLMEVLGEGGPRAWAYRRAARALERHEEDLEALAARGFQGVPGVGRSLAALLEEVYRTGEFPYLEELLARVPPGVLELLEVQGLGPKRVRALWEAGVDSLGALVAWAEAGRIRALPGFGARSEAALLEAARFALANARRVHLPTGLEAARLLLADLEGAGIRAELAGSLRRGLETVGSVDLVALAPPERVAAALGVHAQRVEGRVVHGRVEGLPLKVFTARPEAFGTVLLQATGSRAFVEALGPLPELPEEAAVFAALERTFVPPFWREPEHLGLPPPARVVARADLVGLIHAHTTYSDGAASLREMAEAARARGYRYLVVSDHSQAAAYAGGLDLEALEAQWAEIDRLNAELAPFRILKGIEADILPDGRLDYPEAVLARFDVVIGSLHSQLGLDPEAQTARLLRALDNPYLTILGHATGRLLLRRKGAVADWERVLERAAMRGVILEINANPWRLDLDWRVALAWRDRLWFSLGPDAHAVEGMDDVTYGLWMAAKAGLAPERVVNTWTAEALLEHARRHR